jgi:hypothetical protein
MRDDNLVPDHRARSNLGPSHDKAVEEMDADVEIVEEGEKGKTLGLVLTAVKGQPDLSPVTYRIGRLRVTEEELDKYVEQGLL